MDVRFLPHNSHLEGGNKGFASSDPQLRRLKHQVYTHYPSLLDELPTDTPGIYTLGGGRQIGKTTLLKLWMKRLLAAGATPAAIAFFSGELIDDHHALLNILQGQLAEMPADEMRYLLVDEISYIKDWDKTIKYLADAGLLENVVVILTGSDLALIREARMRFPGRRGKSATVDFHLYPLSFRETVHLKKRVADLDAVCDPDYDPPLPVIDALFQELQDYLVHGGYLTAMNDMAANREITPATLNIYADWLRGDMMKRGKQEHYLREILSAIVRRYNSQVTWNAIARDLSIDHPATVADYVAALASMDAVFIQPALLEDKLTAAPKKARKLVFTDPFIFHAVRFWLHPVARPFDEQVAIAIADPEISSGLVEACVANHYHRKYPTYYIKAEGEVDVAVVRDGRFWPVEIKWTGQVRPKDIKQVSKYANGRIFAKIKRRGTILGVTAEPLPLALLRLNQGVL